METYETYNRKGMKAIQIFIDYMRFENRMPTRKEFEREWYGREMPRGKSNYYYQVREKFLEES